MVMHKDNRRYAVGDSLSECFSGMDNRGVKRPGGDAVDVLNEVFSIQSNREEMFLLPLKAIEAGEDAAAYVSEVVAAGDLFVFPVCNVQ